MHYDTWLESDLQQPTGTVIKMQCWECVIWYSDIWRARGLSDQSQAHSAYHVWRNKLSFISFVSVS